MRLFRLVHGATSLKRTRASSKQTSVSMTGKTNRPQLSNTTVPTLQYMLSQSTGEHPHCAQRGCNETLRRTNGVLTKHMRKPKWCASEVLPAAPALLDRTRHSGDTGVHFPLVTANDHGFMSCALYWIICHFHHLLIGLCNIL